MTKNLTNKMSSLDQVMVWCHQATSPFLSQCWPRSTSSYGITRPQQVKQWSNIKWATKILDCYKIILNSRVSSIWCTLYFWPTFPSISDAVYVICFSLILLSVDLSSPHIKNKMSKREFIRNTRRAAQGVNDDFAGHLYDNIYLIGHVAPSPC